MRLPLYFTLNSHFKKKLKKKKNLESRVSYFFPLFPSWTTNYTMRCNWGINYQGRRTGRRWRLWFLCYLLFNLRIKCCSRQWQFTSFSLGKTLKPGIQLPKPLPLSCIVPGKRWLTFNYRHIYNTYIYIYNIYIICLISWVRSLSALSSYTLYISQTRQFSIKISRSVE